MRTAWQREGAELRQRISDLHAGRLDAEERAQAAENALVAQEQEWRARVHEVQRQLRTAHADRDEEAQRAAEHSRQRASEVSAACGKRGETCCPCLMLCIHRYVRCYIAPWLIPAGASCRTRARGTAGRH